jgi:hypothetical protein
LERSGKSRFIVRRGRFGSIIKSKGIDFKFQSGVEPPHSKESFKMKASLQPDSHTSGP